MGGRWREAGPAGAMAALLATGIGAAGGAAQDPAMFRGDPARTGAYEGRGPVRGAAIAWRFATGGAVRTSPAVTGDAVFVGSSDGRVYALDRRTGEERWRHDLGSSVTGSPAVESGVLVTVARDGSVHALAEATGALIWRTPPVPERPLPWGREGWDYFGSSPAIVGNRIVVGTPDGWVRSLDLASGQSLWSLDLGARVRSSPAVSDGVVVVGDDAGVIHGIGLEDGIGIWAHRTMGAGHDSEEWGFDRKSVQASPAVAGGRVHVGSRDGGLYALDLHTGRRLWRVDYGFPWVVASAAVAGGRVVVGSSDGLFVQAVEAATGRERWTTEVGARVFASPAITDSAVYVVDHAGHVRALDPTTGREIWALRLADQIQSSPVPAGDRLYLGADDGAVYALREAPGPARLAVFWDSSRAGRAVQPGGERLRDYLVDRGFDVVDAAGLDAWLRARIGERGRSVIVFALDDVPASVGPGPGDSPGPLRRYLDAGGKVVWPGFPPWSLVRDSTGAPVRIDHSTHRRALGVDLSGGLRGEFPATPTAAGRRWGLRGSRLSSAAVAPGDDVIVLAEDELGRAAAAVRSYGGPEGSGFVVLMGRGAPWESLAEIRAVAEYGVIR